MESERILWIDIAKVLGILLVILGHMKIEYRIVIFIYLFHMPLFFFISGYLEKSKNIKDAFVNGIQKLLVPYILLYLLSYLWWIIVTVLFHREAFKNEPFVYLILKPMLGMFFGSGYHTGYSNMINIQLWFLIALFFCKIIHRSVLTVSKDNIILVLIGNILIIGVVILLKKLNIDLLLSIDSALLVFPFFSAGYFLRNTITPPPVKRKIMLLVIAVLGFILLYIVSPINGNAKTNTANFVYGENIILFYVLGAAGITLMFILSLVYTCESCIITLISSGTLLIMTFHSIINSVILKLLNLNKISINLFPAVLISSVNILLTIPIIVLVSKYFPILTGKRHIKTNIANSIYRG